MMKSEFEKLPIILGGFMAVFANVVLIASLWVTKTSDVWFLVLTGLLLYVLLIHETLRSWHVIYIQEDAIVFRSPILKTEKVYAYEELDGFIDSSLRAKHASYATIFLKKKNRRIRQYITSYYYANYDEIREALNNKLDCLGWENSNLLGQKR
jgi:hypothetical protein